MKYRATLTGVEDLERPTQIFSQTRPPIDEWADKMLLKYPQGAVEVYMVSETLLERRWKAKTMEATKA